MYYKKSAYGRWDIRDNYKHFMRDGDFNTFLSFAQKLGM
jgi:hypothetical protein